MINLLSDEHKAEIRAARTNVLLVRYISLLMAAALVLSGLVAGSWVVLNGVRDSAQTAVNANTQRASQYQATQQQADSFRSDLATAKSILDQKTSFTKLIYRFANVIPPNVVLDSLALDPKTFGTKMTISASAKTFDDASKLKEAFASNQDVFSAVSLLSIQSENGTDGVGSEYPVKVTVSLVVNKGAVR